MSSEGDTLKSVNWTTGMLLTPTHFQRQDEYIDEAFGWLLRHCIPGTGLVGGGVRLESGERGLGRFDPQFEVQDDGTTVKIALLQARGITPNGELAEVAAPRVIRADFRKGDLAGSTELLVYLVRTGEREEESESVGVDEANPNQAAWRRTEYQLALGAEADILGHSLVVGKIRRVSETLGFERDGSFIPACATLLAHSALYGGWTKIQADLSLQAGEYAELHRQVAQYADQIARRGVDSRPDLDTLAFIERAVLSLDNCVYETLDPTRSPQHLFQQIDRVGRRIALALDLSEATRNFFQLLSGADVSYSGLLEEERQLLAGRREVSPREDLRLALERSDQTLSRVRRLVEALAGKYIDYRVNRSIDSLRFLLDRQGDQFFVAVQTPGHPQRDADLLTLVFSQINITGRHDYRLVALGDPNGVSNWQVGDELKVTLRINSAAGPTKPITKTVTCELPGQRNFAVNFETPADVATITGITVTAAPAHRIRGAVLYQRLRGLAVEPVLVSQAQGYAPIGPTPVAPPRPQPGPAAPVIKIRRPNNP